MAFSLGFGARGLEFGMQGIGVRVQESNLPTDRNNSKTLRVLAYGPPQQSRNLYKDWRMRNMYRLAFFHVGNEKSLKGFSCTKTLPLRGHAMAYSLGFGARRFGRSGSSQDAGCRG